MDDSVILSEIVIGERREMPPGEPGCTMSWGQFHLPRASGPVESFSMLPSVITEDGLQAFQTVSEAREYCYEFGKGLQIVIALRMHDDEQARLIAVERADIPGYRRTMSFVAQMVGSSTADQSGRGTAELYISLPDLIARLRKEREAGRKGSAYAQHLERQIAVDFTQRHARDVLSG